LTFHGAEESEAIVLRTYPLRESDLLVTLFTDRKQGERRGAPAMKSRRRLRRWSAYLRAGVYDDRERQIGGLIPGGDRVADGSEVSYPRLRRWRT